MAQNKPRIAIIGGGLGGLTAAALLHKAGFPTRVYEQTPAFDRIGAGIQLGPNLVRVLGHTGVAEPLRQIAVHPDRWVSRKGDTGEELMSYPLGDIAEARYGAPYLVVHRGDFHALLLDAVPPEAVAFGKCLVDLEPAGEIIRLEFDDGTTAEADIVIGADGVYSRVREILLGVEEPRFAGQVAHRAIFPASLVGFEIEDCSKWWADDGRIVCTYYLTKSRAEIFIVSGSFEPAWAHPTSSVPADLDELRARFADFHPEIRQLLAACPAASKWAMFDREPLPLWSQGRIVLLGDACHPMTPYMGQGAAMAIEDAALLTRCLDSSPTDHDHAFRLYEANRKARTALVQATSRLNTWLRDEASTWVAGQADPDWLFGYDAFTEPLVPPSPVSGESGAKRTGTRG